MRTHIFTSYIPLLALLCSTSVIAQNATLTLGPESTLWIDGTSNKSDWTVTATDVAGTLELDESGIPSQATVTVAADKIESNKSKIMDRLMYRALKSDAHPVITYTLKAARTAGEGSDSLSTEGEVRVAGITKGAVMNVEWQLLDDGAVRVHGTHPMKMTDHGMKPPTAMFGALHTANEVVVHFDVVFVGTADNSGLEQTSAAAPGR